MEFDPRVARNPEIVEPGERMTTVTVHQPDFAPWLGFFDRLVESDVFVVLDDAQFLRRGWHHRDRIRSAGGVAWLTVPVLKRGRFLQSIRDVEIDEGRDWRRRHLATLRVAYGRAAGFDRWFPAIAGVYGKNHTRLIDLNLDLIELLTDALEIPRPAVRFASALGAAGQATERIVELVGLVGGDEYLSGLGARSYLHPPSFAAAGIRLRWQQFEPPPYPQGGGAFVPGLSALDALFHCGEEVGRLLRPATTAASDSGRPTP